MYVMIVTTLLFYFRISTGHINALPILIFAVIEMKTYHGHLFSQTKSFESLDVMQKHLEFLKKDNM